MNVVMSKTNHLSLLIPIFIYFSNGGVTAGNKKDVVDNNKNEHDIPLLQTKQGDCISPAHVRCTNFEQAEAFDASCKSWRSCNNNNKQGRAECGKCGGVVVHVAGSARALGACPGLCYL